MNTQNVFELLVLGLKDLFDRPKKVFYPLPTSLLRANQALFQKGKLPPTIWQMLQQCTQPVKYWWPHQWHLPDEFDSAFSLVQGHSLSEEAYAYYYNVLVDKAAVSNTYPSEQIQHALDNLKFKRLYERLIARRQDASEAEQIVIDNCYRQLRSFLITNPFTTSSAIRQAFSTSIMRSQLLSLQEIGDLYDECLDVSPQWLCNKCGPLHQVNGRLRGVQPNRCNNHEPHQVRSIPWENGLLRICPGIHWQVYLPGLPEIDLLKAIEELQVKYDQSIKQLTLWPALDQYDLQITFKDGTVWAVDVKDHRDPSRLAKTLRVIPNTGSLAYRAGFYVIPDQRVHVNHTYMTLLQEKTQLPDHIITLTRSQFVDRVTQQARALSTRRKKL